MSPPGVLYVLPGMKSEGVKQRCPALPNPPSFLTPCGGVLDVHAVTLPWPELRSPPSPPPSQSSSGSRRSPRSPSSAPRAPGASRHRGHKTAVIAVAHAILVMASHLLARQTTYAKLGPDYLDDLDITRATRRYLRGLERLGPRVILERAA